MKLHIAVMGSFLALAACGGSGATLIGGGSTGDDEPTTGGIGGGGGSTDAGSGTDTCSNAYVCNGDITAVSYEAGTLPDDSDDVLRITNAPFDEEERSATYVREPSLDRNGFLAFINDDPKQFDNYLAYYKATPGGEIAVGNVGMDGYQTYGYWGTYTQVFDPAGPDTSGLVRFDGGSAGHITFVGSGQLLHTWADVTLEVDFTDNRLKGSAYNREWRDPITGASGTLTGLVMNDTVISGGAFGGTAVSYDGPDPLESGNYTGAFAGTGEYAGGTWQAESDAEELTAAAGFTEGAGSTPVVFPSAEGITVRDTSSFIVEEVDHGPVTNPFASP